MFRIIRRSYAAIFMAVLAICMFLSSALAEDAKWEYRLDEDGYAHITAFADTSADRVQLPARLEGHDVIGIDTGAFSACPALKEIRLPGSVSALAEGAFDGPESLCLAGYNGSAALNYAGQHGLDSRNLSMLDFLPGVIDLSDVNEGDYKLNGSTVYLRNPQARRIAKEDIFYLPVNNGTAYKAVSFTQENGWVAIQTATPTFDLVVEKLSLRETEFYPDYNGITMLSRDVTFEPAQSRSGNVLSGSFKYQLNPAVTIFVTLSTTLEEFVCDVSAMPFRVNEFTYRLNSSYAINVSASGNVQLLSDINSNKYKEWIDLARIPFASASGMVTASLVFRIRLTLDAGLELAYSVQNLKDGLSYTPQSGWMRLHENGQHYFNFSGHAKLEYTTGLAGTISVPLLKDLITVQANAPITVEGKYAYKSDNPETISCLDIGSKWEAYISAAVGVKSDYFDKKLGINMALQYDSPRLLLGKRNMHFEGGYLVDKCTKKVYWVKLVPGNGEILPDIRVCGNDIPLLPSLSREGYTFTDWYTSPACTADSRVTNDMFNNRDKDLTLYGGWRPAELPEEEEIEFPTKVDESYAGYKYANCPSEIEINGKTYQIRPLSAAKGEPHNTPLRQIKNKIVEDGYMSWEQIWGKKEMPADTVFWAYNLHTSERITHMSYASNFVGTEGNPRCINLSSVSFPNGMIDIGTYIYCTKLTHISLPPALECIRKQAFYGCTGLTQISVPASCKEIGFEAFAHSGLQGISLPNGVEYIGSAFQNAYKLTHASVPSSVIANAYAFKNCFALSSVSIDEGVEKIGKGMFQDCRKLSSVGIPASVKTIDEDAFLRTGVTGISVMGDGVFIGANAFADTPLRSFSGNVSEIRSGAFGDTPNLETVVLSGKDLEVYSSAFGGSGLKNLQIGVSGKLRVSLDNLPHLERLSISADEIVIDCTNLYSLKDVSISANVVQLGSFSGCQNLQKVDVNAMKIYAYADFSSCTSLTVLNLSGVLYGIPNLFATKIRSFSAAVDCNGDDDNMSMYGVTNLNMLNGAINMDSITLSGSLGKVMGNIKDCHELERVELRSAEITSIDMSGFGGVEVYLPDDVPEIISGGTAMIYCKNGSVTAAACDAKGIPHAEPGQKWRMLTIVYNNGQPDGSMLFSAGNAPIALEEPEDINCNFLGWYTDEALTQPYSNLTAMPNHDLTLYAGWELVFFKPRYNGEYDKSNNYSMNGEYGYGSYLSNYTRERTILPIHQVYVLDNCFQTKMLREIIIRDTVKSIGKNVFSAEPYLEKITVDSGNKYYYDVDGVLYSKAGALIACPPRCSNTVLKVPKGIKTIASGAFGSESTISTLEEIHLPDTIRTIEEGALAGLNQYTLIYGPNRTDIASAVEAAGLMYNCYPIAFVLDDEIISILYGKQGELLPAVDNPHLPGRIFQGWSLTEGGRAINLNTYKMPANKLMLYAVHSGSGAVSILPDMLKTIDAEAFEGSTLENVCCQPGLLRIEARAFAGCAQLKVVDLPDTVTFIAEDAFDGSAQVTILAPAGSYAEEFAKAHGIPCKNP